MKILMVAPLPFPYGGVVHWTLLTKERIKRDDQVTLCGFVDNSPKKNGLGERTLWDRVVVSGLEMFRMTAELRSKCKKTKPDVIHMTTSGSFATIRDILMMTLAKSLDIPVVYHLHFGRIPQMAEKNTLEWKLMKKAIGLSAATIAIDAKSWQTLKRVFPEEKIFNVPNPFDLSSCKHTEEEKRKELLFVGHCVKHKGVEELLDAWQELCGRHKDWKLRMVGPYNLDYKRHLSDLYSMERVIFEGEKSHSEVMSLLCGTSIVTLPSHTEGFPNVVLEAMACGKPVVATNVGAIPEALADGAGILIPPQDRKALVQALEKLMTDEQLCVQMGKIARTRLEEKYEMDVVFGVYKTVWDNVLM